MTDSAPGVPGDTVADRCDRAVSGARLRILIVGAGIAGATLAALMRARGEPVAVIERAPAEASGGYMLGLLPLGGRVLTALGLADAYAAASTPMRSYVLHDRHGAPIREYRLTSLVERYGDWRAVERGGLLALARERAGEVVFDATVEALVPGDAAVDVTFSDGSGARFDLVVAADGIGSATRSLVLAPGEVEQHDTGWGGFVLWSPDGGQPPDTYRELWSAGWGVGLYPVPGRLGVFLAGRHDTIAGRDPADYRAEIAARLRPGPFTDALAGAERAEGAGSDDGAYWPMRDIRSQVWSRGRVVLLGDAAAAFLPTAGVGASMAMDSAAALADELSRADAGHLPYALDLYERRQRRRVERAQKNSRDLARVMFVNGERTAHLRDRLARFYSLERLLSGIADVMEG